jgi:uncharacterized membrane protein
MNRAFLIILLPVLLVMLGYIAVFHAMGLAPGYPRIVVAAIVFGAALWWLERKAGGKTSSSRH